MSNHDPPRTMYAQSGDRSASAGLSGAAEPSREGDSAAPPDALPEEVLERIRTLVTDHSIEARRLAVEAAARFPEHAGIQSAKRILNDGEATVAPGGPEPSTTEEFNWLRQPPESARGKWVALVGSEMVASADTLAELTACLRLQEPAKPALVHHLVLGATS